MFIIVLNLEKLIIKYEHQIWASLCAHKYVCVEKFLKSRPFSSGRMRHYGYAESYNDVGNRACRIWRSGISSVTLTRSQMTWRIDRYTILCRVWRQCDRVEPTGMNVKVNLQCVLSTSWRGSHTWSQWGRAWGLHPLAPPYAQTGTANIMKLSRLKTV